MKEQCEKEEISKQRASQAKQIETLKCQHENLKQVNDNLQRQIDAKGAELRDLTEVIRGQSS